MEQIAIFASGVLIGILFSSISWGFIVLMLWNMYLSAERKYKELRNKALKDIHNLKISKTGGFKL